MGDWVEVRSDGEFPLAHVPVPEPVRHELSRLQAQFVRHWLFFDDDPAAAEEVAALGARELPVRHVNIREGVSTSCAPPPRVLALRRDPTRTSTC